MIEDHFYDIIRFLPKDYGDRDCGAVTVPEAPVSPASRLRQLVTEYEAVFISCWHVAFDQRNFCNHFDHIEIFPDANCRLNYIYNENGCAT